MKEKGLMAALIGEVFGTFILILLGDGVVANVGLAPRLATGAYNWNTIVFGWCFAVIVAVFVSAGVSGAHLNPAVTLALAVEAWFCVGESGSLYPGPNGRRIFGRIGRVSGLSRRPGSGRDAERVEHRTGLCVWPGLLGWWCVPANGVPYSIVTCIIAEFFGTAVLLWGILASGDAKNTGLMHNMGPFLVGGTVLAVGLSLGGPSGYAINPARDFGPRLFGTFVGTQGLWDNGYWLIPLIVPFVGGAIAMFCYDWFVTRGLPEKASA